MLGMIWYEYQCLEFIMVQQGRYPLLCEPFVVMSRQYAQDGEEPQVRHLREDSGMLHCKRDGRRVVR